MASSWKIRLSRLISETRSRAWPSKQRMMANLFGFQTDVPVLQNLDESVRCFPIKLHHFFLTTGGT